MAAANWDYVIVGAGSAGCVLANRLSASGKLRAGYFHVNARKGRRCSTAVAMIAEKGADMVLEDAART